MDDDPGGSRGRWRGWPRWAGLLAVTVSIALATAACGGGGGGNAAGSGSSPSPSSLYAKLLAYSQCIRAHGVPSFPDPDSNGVFNGSGMDMQTPAMQAAKSACKSLLPPASQIPGGAGHNSAQALRYSQCMRAHGIPNFPDPDSHGNFTFKINSGINQQSAAYHAAQQACQSIMPGLPAAGG